MIEKLTIIYYFIKARYFSDFKTRKQLRQYQRFLWQKQLAFLRKNSDFYAKQINLSTFPLMDKRLLMANFNSFNTVGLDRDEAIKFAIACEKSRQFDKKLKGVTIGLSSGTSGHRGIFAVSDEERAIWAGTILAKLLPKGKILGHRIAFFMRADSELYETVNTKLLQFSFLDMQDNLAENLTKLKEIAPTILVAPPSMLIEIAKANLDISPMKVISIAEVLEVRDASLIKSALNLPVIHQVYQCTEGFLGATCQYGTLHLNEEYVQIEKEWIDDKRFYPIITDLKRRAQPIVRYRLNDILVKKATTCECGSLLLAIEKIEGRQDDVFEFIGLETEVVTVFPDYIRRCLLFSDQVEEYRVQQVDANQLDVLIDTENSQVKQEIIQNFKQLSFDLKFQMPDIKFKAYDYDGNKKLKRIEKL